MKTLRMRITPKSGDVWFASCPDVCNDPVKTLAKVQRKANKQVPGTVYELATEAQYQDYHSGRGM